MEREPLYVCMTMDVERIRDFSPTGGPPDWASAARSVRAYCDALAGRVSAELLRLSESEEAREKLGRELQAVTAPLAELGAYQRAAVATLEGSPTGEGSA